METFTSRSMHDMWRFIKKSGLSMPQFGLLRRLYHGGECEVHEVGTHFDITAAAASQLVDRLVQAGLVGRTENPDDRRARHVALTAKGRALLEKGTDESYRWVNDLAATLAPHARASLREALPLLMEAEASMPRPESISARAAIRSAR
jgi:DNA-binding MarR family transcriptional regulator